MMRRRYPPITDVSEQPGLFSELTARPVTPLRFDGPDLEPDDHARLARQQQLVYGVMADHRWHTLDEIAHAIGALHTSASARLRDLRKPRFGAHVIEKRRVEGAPGLWEYRLGS